MDEELLEMEEGVALEGVPLEEEVIEPKFSDSELIGKLDDERDRSDVIQTSLIENRDEAFQYFNGEMPPKPTDKSKSGAVSKDVENGIWAVLAEARQSFNKSDLAKVLPDIFRDRDQAQRESDVINSVFRDFCGGDVLMQNILFDSLLQRNSLAKVYIEEKMCVSYEQVEGITEIMLPQVLSPSIPGEDIEVMSQTSIQEAVINEYGEMISPAIYSLEVKRLTPKQKIKIECIPVDEVRINSDLNVIDLQQARFVCHERKMSVSELVEMGFDKDIVKDLPEYSVYRSDMISRLSHSDATSFDTADESTELKEIYEAWYRIDADDDGIAELRHFMWASDELLVDEVVDFIPLSAGTSHIIPHQFSGKSLFDRLKEIQRSKTTFHRQAIDNAIRSNRERTTAVKGQVDMERLINGSNVVPVTSPTAVNPMPWQNLLPGSIAMLQYLDEVRAESGGGTIDSIAENQIVSDQSSHATERLVTRQELSTDSIVCDISSTIVHGIFLLIHKTLRSQYQGPLPYYKDDQLFRDYPQQWKDIDSVKVATNLSSGQKNKMVGALLQVAQMIDGFDQKGKSGILFDDQSAYRLAIEIANTSGVRNPQDFILDPSRQEAQQIQQQRQQQQQQEKQLQMQMMEVQLTQPEKMAQIESQAKLMTEQMKQQNSMVQFREEMELKYNQLLIELKELRAKYGLEEDKMFVDLVKTKEQQNKPNGGMEQ